MHDIPADEVPSGLIELDAEGRIVDANAAFRFWAGPAVVGRRLSDFIDSTEPARALAEGDIVFLRAADGRRRPVLVEGAAPGIVVILDASRRQEVEDGLLETQALVRRTQIRLQLVIDASIAFAAAATEQEVAELLADIAARAYAAEESLVLLAGASGALAPVAGSYPFGDLSFGELLLPALQAGEVVKVSGVEEAYALGSPLGRAFASAGVHSVIVAPIRHESETLGAFACFFLHPRGFDEQASPFASALAGQAAQVITGLRLQRALEHAATHDATTGLPNRRFLEEQLRTPRPDDAGATAIFFVDLDGFKRVNDQYGHAVGDRLLHEVGARLRGTVREEHIVARYGGDEFVVVADVPSAAVATEMAERIRSRLEQPYGTIPALLTISASIGVSVAQGAGVIGADHLLRLADQAMYAAKDAGGNRIAAAGGPLGDPQACVLAS